MAGLPNRTACNYYMYARAVDSCARFSKYPVACALAIATLLRVELEKSHILVFRQRKLHCLPVVSRKTIVVVSSRERLDEQQLCRLNSMPPCHLPTYRQHPLVTVSLLIRACHTLPCHTDSLIAAVKSLPSTTTATSLSFNTTERCTSRRKGGA